VSFLVLVFVRAIFVMVPLNMTYLHCLHSLFEHLFNLYYHNGSCQSESTYFGYIICGTVVHNIHVVYKGTKVDLYVMSIEVN